MNKEQRQLLLQDLCARLPYGVIVDNPSPAGGAWDEVINIDTSAKTVTLLYNGRVFSIDYVKPYLRPMSSMTEEEREEFYKECEKDYKIAVNEANRSYKSKFDEYAPLLSSYNKHDWLNANHFDYRGLIPMGLALEAPEGMYK